MITLGATVATLAFLLGALMLATLSELTSRTFVDYALPTLFLSVALGLYVLCLYLEYGART